jgi:hypothetical protein
VELAHRGLERGKGLDREELGQRRMAMDEKTWVERADEGNVLEERLRRAFRKALRACVRTSSAS